MTLGGKGVTMQARSALILRERSWFIRLAEGATAPETLRHPYRRVHGPLWRVSSSTTEGEKRKPAGSL